MIGGINKTNMNPPKPAKPAKPSSSQTGTSENTEKSFYSKHPHAFIIICSIVIIGGIVMAVLAARGEFDSSPKRKYTNYELQEQGPSINKSLEMTR